MIGRLLKTNMIQIPINNLTWTKIPVTTTFYRNNSNVFVYLQQTDADVNPVAATDGLILKPFESFQLQGAKFYWAKSVSGNAEIIDDLCLKTPINDVLQPF